MIVNSSNKWIYIAVPKTATASMHLALGLGSNHPEPHKHHIGIRDFLVQNPTGASYLKFGFVRNPLTRFASTFNDFRNIRRYQYSRLIYYDTPLLSEYRDFEHFCHEFPQSEWVDDIFFKPQVELVTLQNGDLIDYVGRFENLPGDFYKICPQINIRGALLKDKFNAGVGDANYEMWYTPETRDIIANFYKEDMKVFGYEI